MYNYGRPGFSMATGHFTQVVWRGTTRIGCGAALCRNLGNRVILVCNYRRGGNIMNDGYFQANVLPAGAAGARRRGGGAGREGRGGRDRSGGGSSDWD